MLEEINLLTPEIATSSILKRSEDESDTSRISSVGFSLKTQLKDVDQP